MAAEKTRDQQLADLEVRAFGPHGLSWTHKTQLRDPDCIPALTRFLSEETSWGRHVRVVMMLAESQSPQAVPTLVAETRSSNKRARNCALRGLAALTPPPSAVSTLTEVLRDGPYRASLAMKVLADIGDASAHAALEEAIDDGKLSRGTRRRARKALTRFSQSDS
jgi:HEAT repeat protein